MTSRVNVGSLFNPNSTLYQFISDKSNEEISEIWKQHHQNKKFVFACIPVSVLL